MCKPLAFQMALEERGLEETLKHVGVEPSGDAFNSIELDAKTSRPFNPMINAGAIAIACLIKKSPVELGVQTFVDKMSDAAGRQLRIDQAVLQSEILTGNRNRAIAYLMRNFGIIDEQVEEALHQYFAQCSMLVNCQDMAMIGGMSRPLLKLGGGSGEILRDLVHFHRVSEAEALISGAEGGDELRHIRASLQALEPRGGFEDAGGDPAQHHLATPPALHVAFDVAGPADEAFGGVGGGQRALETGREAEREHGHRLLEPFPHTGRRAGMLPVEAAREVAQEPCRGLHAGPIEIRRHPAQASPLYTRHPRRRPRCRSPATRHASLR